MADSTDLTVVVVLTEKDLYKANVSIVQRKRSIARRVLSVLTFAVSVAVLFYFAMAISEPDYPWLRAAVLGTCLGLALELFFWPFQWALIHGLAYYAARNLVRSKPTVLEAMTYHFSPTGASYSGPTSSGHLDWRSYIKIRETSEQFLLYVQQRLANVLPKRAFQSVADVRLFRQLVRENFSGETELLTEG
jgi:hypothetical protein